MLSKSVSPPYASAAIVRFSSRGAESAWGSDALWRDLESLRAFSGKNWDAPAVTADEAPLVEAMYAEHYLKFGKGGQSE